MDPGRTELDVGGPDVVVADFNDVICPNDDECIAFKNGLFTYRDKSHLTPTFSASLKDRWVETLMRATRLADSSLKVTDRHID